MDILIPIIRKTYPELMAESLIDVQPLSQPTGKVYKMDIQRDLGLRSIRVEKVQLLEKLKENMVKHVADYNEAMEGFRDDSIAKLQKILRGVKKGGEIPKNVQFVKPESHESEYETVIEMLEMSVDTHIDLTQAEFKQYIQDKWNWSDTFNNTKALYSSSKG